MVRFVVQLLVSLLLVVDGRFLGGPNGHLVLGFWLTDTSLLQATPIGVMKAEEAEKRPNEVEVVSVSSSAQAVSGPRENLQTWIRVPDSSQPQGQQQPVCQCNADWLQNQTSTWLNEWLASAGTLGQLRLLMSNSTGAKQVQQQQQQFTQALGNNVAGKLRANTDARHHHSSNTISNHWNLWSRSNGKLSSTSGSNVSRPLGASQRSRKQAPLRPVVVERGPPGEKGQPGARGEKGERGEPGQCSMGGLISVKDRDALFDLDLTEWSQRQASSGASSGPGSSGATEPIGGGQKIERTQSGGQAAARAEGAERRLVFIESEQMLVIITHTGWRPVQLLTQPLRDFRKSIAKFSLISAEERRRLLLSGGGGNRGENMDNSIKLPARHRHLDGISGDSSLMTALSESSRRFIGGTARSNQLEVNEEDFATDLGDEDDEDEEDDDEDEEEDEEDDNTLADEEADDKSELPLVGGGREESASSPASPATADGRKKESVVSAAPAPTSATGSESRRTSESKRLVTVSGRSGASSSTLLLAGTESTLGRQQQAAAQMDGQRSMHARNYQDGRMKLRIAALNEPFSGNIHGIRGADFECKRNAARANIRGSFRAFLASGFQNLYEVVRYNIHKYPIVNLRGEPLANSWHGLFKQAARVANPLSRIYSFDGRHVATDSNWPNKLVWHGANSKAGHRDLQHNCDGWHSDSLNKFGYATPLHLPRGSSFVKKRQRKRFLADLKQPSAANNLTSQQSNDQVVESSEPVAVLEAIEKYPCRMPLVVLCVETIGQQLDSSIINKRIFNNPNDLESNNALI